MSKTTEYTFSILVLLFDFTDTRAPVTSMCTVAWLRCAAEVALEKIRKKNREDFLNGTKEEDLNFSAFFALLPP